MLSLCLIFPGTYYLHDSDTGKASKIQFPHRNTNLPQQQTLIQLQIINCTDWMINLQLNFSRLILNVLVKLSNCNHSKIPPVAQVMLISVQVVRDPSFVPYKK